MSGHRQWLELGLEGLPAARAERIRLFRLLLAASSALRGRLDRALAPSGITTQQAAMLQFIEAQAEAPTISQVAEGLAMTHQNVKQIALAVERKGFVEIAVDPADRRARRLRLTEHHYRFWRQRNDADFSGVEDWTGALSDAEVATLVGLLGKLRGGLAEVDRRPVARAASA